MLWLFILNRLVDVTFLTDLILNFFMAYTIGQQDGNGARWETNLDHIRRHYLRGWFSIDFLSTLVSIFDIISYSREDADELSRVKALRLLRVLRLIKLLRLLRGLRLFQRWETRLSIDYGMLQLVNAMCTVLIFSHWSACLWMLQALPSAERP